MRENRFRIEIVAPVHNRKAITIQCLRSLSRIDTDNLDVHVVIVDDGSTDGTSEAINSEFPDVEIVKGDGNLWFTEGTNTGVRAAIKHDPHFVLMINDDAVFDAGFLRKLVETAVRHERSVVGSLLLLWDTPHKLFQVSPVWDISLGDWRHWHKQTVWTVPDRPWNVDVIVGNCVLVPVEAFREAGLMDSRRYPNFGDSEFTPRLKRLGWRLLIDPRSRVFCQPNTPPPMVREMGFKKMVSALILDLGNVHNLRRRFYANMAGAPTKLQGLIGYMMFLKRAVLGEGRKAPESEVPLSEKFASAVVDD